MMGFTSRRTKGPMVRRKTNRRRFARPAMPLIVGLMLLSACGNAAGGTPTTAVGSVSNTGSPTGSTAAATPVAGASLPMTVTAGGVALELQSIDSTATATRFSFMIQLAPGQLSRDHPAPFVLGSDPASDVTINGITPGANDPYVSGSEGISNPPVIAFTLDYQSPFPSGKTVTITIKQLTLPVGSSAPTASPAPTSKQIDGPWVFAITPSSVANQPVPTPFGSIGRFGEVSVAQAQKLSSFPITAPSPLPAILTQNQMLERNEFNVTGYGVGVPYSAPANYVMLIYTQPVGQDVWLVETSDAAAVPNISGNSATVLMPLEPSGTTQTLTISPGSVSNQTIQGVTVTRFEVSTAQATGPTVYYVWKLGGVSYYIRYVMDKPPSGVASVTDADLQQMIASIIQQRSIGGSPPGQQASPTPSASPSTAVMPTPDQSGTIRGITFQQAQQLAAFKLFMPTFIPPSLKLDGLNAQIPPEAMNGVPKGTPWMVTVYFKSSGGQPLDVTLMETSVDLNPNNAAGAEVPVTNGAGTPTVMPANGVVTTIQVSGITVTRHDVANQDGKVISLYYWKQGGTTMQLTTFAGYPPSEHEIEQMIASMLAQGS